MSQQAFVHKIADGKLLMRFSYMTHNVTCDCCRSEEKLQKRGQPDILRHKPWCVVMAARQLLPGFIPSHYPDDLSNLRGYLEKDCNELQFAWLEEAQCG